MQTAGKDAAKLSACGPEQVRAGRWGRRQRRGARKVFRGKSTSHEPVHFLDFHFVHLLLFKMYDVILELSFTGLIASFRISVENSSQSPIQKLFMERKQPGETGRKTENRQVLWTNIHEIKTTNSN